MATLTKQSMLANLQLALEAGYKGCERGENLLAVQMRYSGIFEELVKACDNCPNEIVRLPLLSQMKRKHEKKAAKR